MNANVKCGAISHTLDAPTAQWDGHEYTLRSSPFKGQLAAVVLADGVPGYRVERFANAYRRLHPDMSCAALVLMSNNLACDTARSVKFEAFAPHGTAGFAMTMGRFYLAHAIIKLAPSWSKVLLADTTDLYLQRSPFGMMGPPGLHYTLEEPWKRVRTDPDHKEWLECYGGKDVWWRVDPKAHQANSGFVGLVGTPGRAALKAYVDLGNTQMARWENGTLPRCFHDQGLFNLALRTHVFGPTYEFTSVVNDRHELRGLDSRGMWREKNKSQLGMADGMMTVEPSNNDLPATVVHHWNRKLLSGAPIREGRQLLEVPRLSDMAGMIRSRHFHVYDFDKAPNTRVVYTDEYRPFAFDKPDSLQNISEFCPHLVRSGVHHDNRDWRFCTGEKPGVMKMHVVVQEDAMFDRGAQHMGATFDKWRVYLMSHPNSRPALHMQNVRHYDQLAQALEPYASEAASHFWFGTVQHVLTLYDTLPGVPIVVAWSAAMEKLYDALDLNMSRIVRFDPAVTYAASRLYSVMYQPWSRDMQGGEPVSPQSMRRVFAHVRPVGVTSGRLNAVLIDRADRGARRCTNHAEMDARVHGFAQDNSMGYTKFVGSEFTLREAQEIFKDAEIVVAPHGGALLNMIFMQPGMSVVEIGYYERNASAYRSMRHPPWYFVMAQILGLRYQLVLAPGSYNGHIDCPVDTVLKSMYKAVKGPTPGRALRPSSLR